MTQKRLNTKRDSQEKAIGAGVIEGLKAQVLRRQESARTTFSLPQKSYDSLSVISRRFNYGTREALDACIMKILQFDDQYRESSKLFSDKLAGEKFTRKTQVLSKNALKRLDSFAEQNHVPRNHVLAWLIALLETILVKNTEEVKATYEDKAVQKKIGDMCAAVETMEAELRAALGNDDPIVQILSLLGVHLMNADMEIEEEIDRLSFSANAEAKGAEG